MVNENRAELKAIVFPPHSNLFHERFVLE